MKQPKDMTDAELDAEAASLQRLVSMVAIERQRRRVVACDHDWQSAYNRDEPQGRKSCQECTRCGHRKNYH